MLQSARVGLPTVLWMLLASPLVGDDGPVALKYAASTTPLIYRTTTTLKQQQAIGGMNFDTELTTTQTTVWTLLRTGTDGILHWQSENKRLKVEGRVGFLGDYSFDSQDKARERGSQLDAALSPAYEAFSGAVFEVSLDSQGRVQAVTGYDGFITPLVKDDFFALQYTFGGSDKGATLSYQEQFPIFSDEPVKPGQSWSVPYDFEVPAIGRTSGTKTFTFAREVRDSGRRIAEVDVAYDIAIESDVNVSGLRAKGTVRSSESSGRARFDVESGQLLSLQSSLTATGTVTVEVGDQALMVPTTQTWQVAVERQNELRGQGPQK